MPHNKFRATPAKKLIGILEVTIARKKFLRAFMIALNCLTYPPLKLS